MNENIIEVKNFDFAVRIVELYKHLTKTKREFVMANNFCDVVPVLVPMWQKLKKDKAVRISTQK